MANYSFDTDYISEKLVPPVLRSAMRLAWVRVLLASIKAKYDSIFGITSYTKGYAVAVWNAGTNYAIGIRAKYGISVYEALTANVGLTPPENPSDWLLYLPNFVGTDERVKYNGQKMVLEYVLNRYLNTTATTIPTIYITNNVVDVNGFYMGFGNGQGDLGEMGNASTQDDFLGISYTLNQYAFTIYVPAALYATLGTTAVNRENRVRNVADKYVIAGMSYNII